MGEGDWIVEGGVAAAVRHPEAWGRLEHAGLERGEGAGGGFSSGDVGTDRAGRGVLCSPAGRVAVLPLQFLPHQLGRLVRVTGVKPAWIVVARVRQPLLHQLRVVAVAVHLGPVVIGRAAQRPHARGGRVVRPHRHDRRPLVAPVRVLLHVLGQVGLLCVRLATVGTDVCLQMLGLLVLGNVLQQRGLVVEALVAGVTLVGLVSLVAAGVGLQVGQLGERLGAA